MHSIVQIVQPLAPPAASRGAGRSEDLTGVEFAAEFQWQDNELPVSGLPGPGLGPWRAVWSEGATPADGAIPPAPVVMTDHDLSGDSSDREVADQLVALQTLVPEPPGDTPEPAPSLQLQVVVPTEPMTPSVMSPETPAPAFSGHFPSGEARLPSSRLMSEPVAHSLPPAAGQTANSRTTTQAIPPVPEQEVPAQRVPVRGLGSEIAPPVPRPVARDPNENGQALPISRTENTPVPLPDAMPSQSAQDVGTGYRPSSMENSIAEGRFGPALPAPSHGAGSTAQPPNTAQEAMPKSRDGTPVLAQKSAPSTAKAIPAATPPRPAGNQAATPRQGSSASSGSENDRSTALQQPEVPSPLRVAATLASPVQSHRIVSPDSARPSIEGKSLPNPATVLRSRDGHPSGDAAPPMAQTPAPRGIGETQARVEPVSLPPTDPSPREIPHPVAPVQHETMGQAAGRSSPPPFAKQEEETPGRSHWLAPRAVVTPSRGEPAAGAEIAEPSKPAERPMPHNPTRMADTSLQSARADVIPAPLRPSRQPQPLVPPVSVSMPSGSVADASAMTQQPAQPRSVAVPSPQLRPIEVAPRQPIPTATPEPSVPQVTRPKSEAAVTAPAPRQAMPDMTARGDFAPSLADPVSIPDAPLPAPAHADIRPTEPAPIPRPDPVPTQLAQRIAAVPMMTDRDAPLELTLDPPELGAIRVSVSRGAEGMVLHLQADLPETLDLLRRNGAALMQELQRQGLDHAGFSFSGRDPGGQQHRPDAPPPVVREDDAQIHPSHIPDRSPVASARTGQSGLDIRL